MKFRKLLVLALSFVASASQAQMSMPSLPVDTAVRIGKLDNGLTYYIRYNNWPEHRANFYIAQKVGSIQEEESQRGLAHFLEHMCFNGTDNFKGNDLIRYCESIGVQFGGDLNAYTSIDQTVYNIDNVPTARQSSLDSCLLILRDWADGLTLDPEEIDKERGVIHEEWRMRTSASSRLFERNLEKLYPGSKYGKRYPIGLMSVIDNFAPKELRDYYEKWYHPQNQGIIVVGDVDVDHTEAMIKKLFGPIRNPENPAPIVDEVVPDNAEPIVIIDKDKEYQSHDIDIMFKHDVFPDSLKQTPQYLVYNYVKQAATSMLNSRFGEAAQKADCPYVSASAFDGNYIFAKTKDAFGISVSPKDMSLIEPSLKAALIEARKAAEFGFTPTEYARFKESMLSALDKMYSNKDKRYTSQFYNECKAHFLSNAPMPSIDYSYQMMKQVIPAIPLEVINSFMSELLPKNDSNMVIINFNNEKEGNVYPTEAGLLNAVKEARAQQIEAFVDNVKNEPLIAKMPKPGKIKKEESNEKFGYTKLTLSNGATVILKKTDFKKDQVVLTGEGKGGGSLYPNSEITNLNAFDQVIGYSGLGNFSSTELGKVLAGKIANVDLRLSGTTMTVNGSSTPKDVETMLQMNYLYFTNIKKDTDAFNNLISSYEIELKNRELSPDIAFSDSATATFYGHNPRLKPMLLEDVKNIDYDRILQIAKERTANAAGWTFTIIGNYDEATIRPLICQYIASLPAKGKVVNGKRTAFLEKGIVDNTFTRKMETPKAKFQYMWYNEDMPYSLENVIRADIAGQVLDMIFLKKIREEESAAYSVGARGMAQMREDKTHNIMIYAICPVKPEKKDIATAIMEKEVKNMETECDASMVAKVKELMLKQADDAVKTNGYWLNIMSHWNKYGIDMHTDYKKLVEAQTPEAIMQFMKEFNASGNRLSVCMMPAE